MEFLNNNLYPNKTYHKYRGNVMVTTFGADPGKNDAFDYTEDFEHYDLLEARRQAIEWYIETREGLEKVGKYFLPFASPKDFIEGKHAAYSVSLSLVQCYNGEEDEYDLLGSEQQTQDDTLEMEKLIISEYLSNL
jgi:hypothetical protein